MFRMNLYSTRQNKKSLKIEHLLGVSVVNVKNGTKYAVKFRAEVRRNGSLLSGGTATTPEEAAVLANNLFKEVYGGIRNAKKAGYWNSVA